MTHDEIILVQTSWEKVIPISQTAGELFYDRFLEIQPQYSDHFSCDHVEQLKALMDTIGLIVNKLDDPYSMLSIYKSIENDDVAYGFLKVDYNSAEIAFSWALKQGLKNDFTEDVKHAWAQAFKLIFTLINVDDSKIH